MSSLLLRELNNLRSQRVRLRKAREKLAQDVMLSPQKRFGPDGLNNQLTAVELQLRSTTQRWQELHAMLGLRLPGPPVKLR
jgi:hypothetical protein